MKPIFTNLERSRLAVISTVAFLALLIGVSVAISPKPVDTLPGEGDKDLAVTNTGYVSEFPKPSAENPFNGFKGFTIVQGADVNWEVSRGTVK